MKSEELMRLLHQLAGMTRRRQKEGAEGHPGCGTFRERGRILICLEKEEKISQCRLAELLEIRPQSLSELLGKLENDGLIERTRSEDDKREILVSLSSLGRAHVDSVKKERERYAAEFFSPLTEEEQEALCALMTKLAEAKKARGRDE